MTCDRCGNQISEVEIHAREYRGVYDFRVTKQTFFFHAGCELLILIEAGLKRQEVDKTKVS